MMTTMSGDSVDQRLKEIYYDPEHPAAFGGVARLARAANVSLKVAKEWLKGQDAYTLHRPARKTRYKTRKYYTSGIDHQWQADLVDMQQENLDNDGYKYILTVIDMFSRYGWAQPVKTKSPQHVKPAFEAIFKMGRKPFKIQTDQGLEFESKAMQEFWQSHHIKQFSVKSAVKAGMVERFNGTLKNKMWEYFRYNATHRWANILQKLVNAYNKGEHRMIGMTPNEASNKQNEIPLWLKQEAVPVKEAKRVHIKVGDHVRLSKKVRTFARGFLPQWTEEVFVVTSVRTQEPIQITVKDLNGEPVEGSFYKEEVQVVAKPERYNIEHVVQTRKVRGKKEYLVKWLGYPASFNSWVGEEAIQKLNGGE